MELKRAIKLEKSPIYRKLLDLYGMNQLLSLRIGIEQYAKQVETITRPKDLARVFVYGDEGQFLLHLQIISNWRVSVDRFISPKILGNRGKIGQEAIGNTFFKDEGKLFLPSKYFSLVNPNTAIIGRIEKLGSDACKTDVKFDPECYVREVSAQDPINIEDPDLSSSTQIFLGDKLMYCYVKEGELLAIQLVKLNY